MTDFKPLDPNAHCGQPYEWVEEPGEQSRVLEWVRECRSCRYSPDRHSRFEDWANRD